MNVAFSNSDDVAEKGGRCFRKPFAFSVLLRSEVEQPVSCFCQEPDINFRAVASQLVLLIHVIDKAVPSEPMQDFQGIGFRGLQRGMSFREKEAAKLIGI